jgi:hypothetical protein
MVLDMTLIIHSQIGCIIPYGEMLTNFKLMFSLKNFNFQLAWILAKFEAKTVCERTREQKKKGTKKFPNGGLLGPPTIGLAGGKVKSKIVEM